MNMDIKSLDARYIAPTYARFPLSLTEGRGALLWDDTGREYIDMGSGIAVNTFGAADTAWAEAVCTQVNTLQHTSNLYSTAPGAQLAEMLCQRTGMRKVFYCNSGAEANECAIKAARRRAVLKYGAGHHTIVSLRGSFHGRTMATLSATGQERFHVDFGPFPEGFVSVGTEDPAEFDALTKSTPCAAVMLEMIQGESGVHVLSAEFVREIARIAAERDVLLIVDEVQTGSGRTGRLFSYMHYGVTPDIVTTAKGLAGGLPFGCCLLGEKAKDAFAPGTHGSTFGGNPVCCAGALSVLTRLTDAFLDEVAAKGAYLKQRLPQAEGLGLMLGVPVKKPVAEVLAALRERGVLALSAQDRLRLLPPLNIDQALLEKAADAMGEVIAE